MKSELLKKVLTRRAVDSAISSLELEGFKFTKEEKEDFDRIVQGEMTFEEHRDKYIKLARKLGKEG